MARHASPTARPHGQHHSAGRRERKSRNRPAAISGVAEQSRAHLAAAGGNVPAMIREHAKRISYVHLKGWQQEPFAFTPLDRGTLNMQAITAALISATASG